MEGGPRSNDARREAYKKYEKERTERLEKVIVEAFAVALQYADEYWEQELRELGVPFEPLHGEIVDEQTERGTYAEMSIHYEPSMSEEEYGAIVINPKNFLATFEGSHLKKFDEEQITAIVTESVAHEYGHHIQALFGALTERNDAAKAAQEDHADYCAGAVMQYIRSRRNDVSDSDIAFLRENAKVTGEGYDHFSFLIPEEERKDSIEARSEYGHGSHVVREAAFVEGFTRGGVKYGLQKYLVDRGVQLNIAV